jgi:hypothetical protein
LRAFVIHFSLWFPGSSELTLRINLDEPVLSRPESTLHQLEEGGAAMNKVFHYHSVKVIVTMAGFPPDEAQTIAYASQYADDATEHKPMRIQDAPAEWTIPERYKKDLWFDPTCTAHSAKTWHRRLQKWAKFYLKPSVQRKILIPFHFMPGEAMREPALFDYVTKKNGTLAGLLIETAKDSLLKAKTNDQRNFGLVKLGVAIHTYADTWSHAGFSGRHSSLENDIKDIKRKGNGSAWSNLLSLAASYAAPDVGHAEALDTPDLSYVSWKATYANKKKTPRKISRDNTVEFLEAAQNIYDHLKQVSPMPNNSIPWKDFARPLEDCLQKEENWSAAFSNFGIDFSYTHYDWRESTLAGDSVDWDDFDDAKDFVKLEFKFTGQDKRWFMFHKSAYEQRKFALQRIPETWQV